MGQISKRPAERSSTSRRANPHTIITEVIPADEDKGLTLTDRLAAATAALLICGLCYFFLCFLITFDVGIRILPGEDLSHLGWILSLGVWGIPTGLTVLTTLGAFMLPGAAARVFGKLMKPFENMAEWL